MSFASKVVRAAAPRIPRPRKAVLTLTPAAVVRLRALTDGPEPKVVRVGIRTKGCSGQQYDLQYTTKKEKFDEEIKQDGVTVLVDNKALLSVLGSEMDYVEDKLSAQFVFNNPNVKESCGCGMSFMTSSSYYNKATKSSSTTATKASTAGAALGATSPNIVPALVLKPFFNFKALSSPEALAAMTANIKDRHLPDSISANDVMELHKVVTEMTVELDKARAERNRIAAEMKELFSGGGGGGSGGSSKGKKKQQKMEGEGANKELSREEKEARRQELVERGRVLKEQIHSQETELTLLENRLFDKAVMIPNTTHPDSPIGPESSAQLTRIHGIPRLNQGVKAFARPGHVGIGGEEGGQLLGDISSYPLHDHVSLAKQLDLFDFESATNVTGARWYYLKNEAALLELALIQFATQRAVKAGFMPVITPDVVRPEVVQACGFQPRDEASQTYWVSTIAPGSSKALTPEGIQHHQHASLCLVATAEIALAGMNLNRVLEESQLPIKMAGFGRAFRAEAGSRGAEVKGLYRVHQFSKVELFVVSKNDPEESDRILEDIRSFQEDIFEELGLCFRVLDMPTEELGASAYKKYDIEAWMPGRNTWGEISSASNCTDYQSRRLNIRYRTNKIISSNSNSSSGNGDGNGSDQEATSTSNSITVSEFAHTLNGTAMAIPRIIVALLETFQMEDGSVHLPECLWSYMGGIKVIHPKKPSSIKA
ncbi:seryl-tRNA synthetase [Entomortierella beljakovae]|nr:seryl-tRNA synthetase [Entomortierella beljakovae]